MTVPESVFLECGSGLPFIVDARCLGPNSNTLCFNSLQDEMLKKKKNLKSSIIDWERGM